MALFKGSKIFRNAARPYSSFSASLWVTPVRPHACSIMQRRGGVQKLSWAQAPSSKPNPRSPPSYLPGSKDVAAPSELCTHFIMTEPKPCRTQTSPGHVPTTTVASKACTTSHWSRDFVRVTSTSFNSCFTASCLLRARFFLRCCMVVCSHGSQLITLVPLRPGCPSQCVVGAWKILTPAGASGQLQAELPRLRSPARLGCRHCRTLEERHLAESSVNYGRIFKNVVFVDHLYTCTSLCGEVLYPIEARGQNATFHLELKVAVGASTRGDHQWRSVGVRVSMDSLRHVTHCTHSRFVLLAAHCPSRHTAQGATRSNGISPSCIPEETSWCDSCSMGCLFRRNAAWGVPFCSVSGSSWLVSEAQFQL